MLVLAASVAAWQSRPTADLLRPLTGVRARAPVAAAGGARADDESTISTISGLLDDPRAFLQQAQEDPSTLLQLVKDAGIAGAISYTVVELSFFSVALPIGYFSWHASTGEWLQPLLLLQDDGVEGKARVLGLLLSYVVLLKALFPLRLGSTLLLTPVMQGLISGGGSVLGGFGLGRTKPLKRELLGLAAASRGGLVTLGAEEQARFDEIVAELRELSPAERPASDPRLTGDWECQWTSEKEINFAVEKGLFGEPWRRTVQSIDVAAGTLENRIEFEDGLLRVCSTFAPDGDNGRRFNFAFESCDVRWRSVSLPLPPVGKGWGELVYLDDDFRIQRDVRGDLLVATRLQ